MAMEGDVGSTTLAERTLVDGERDEREETASRKHQHGRDASSSSLSLPTHGQQSHQLETVKKSLDTQDAGGDSMDGNTTDNGWDPLHTNGVVGEKTMEKGGLHDRTVIIEEEDDVVDSKGKLLHSEDEDEGRGQQGGGQGGKLGIKPSPVGSRRASHLRLDLKPPSPQPWDQIDPPSDNNLKVIAGYYSPGASQKFRTLQSASARPLIPKSSYYFGPPGPDSAYGTAPTGQIGVHHPREILRLERDYSGGELIQFTPIYPLELDGRITPTQFLESVNAINELLISAHSLRHSLLDNMLAVFTLQLSRLFITPHFDKEMQRLRTLIDNLNTELYNPAGLNILWPRNVAFLYLEIEYY